MKKISLVLLVLLMGLVLSACGGGEEATDEGSSSSGGASIDIMMNDIYYGDTNDNATNPPTWTVPAGQQVTLNAENLGSLEHTWVIINKDAELPDVVDTTTIGDVALYESASILGGDTTSTSFRAPAEAGTYIVVCSVAGHYPLMQGELIVE